MRRHSNQIVMGVVLMGLGAALLLENVGILDVGALWRYWPLMLIAMGFSRLLETPRRSADGIWFMMIGTWLLLNMLDILTWRESWPLAIVAVGVSMVVRAMSGEDKRAAVVLENGAAQDREPDSLGGAQ